MFRSVGPLANALCAHVLRRLLNGAFWAFGCAERMKLAGTEGPSPNISVTTITAIPQDQRSAVTAPSLVTRRCISSQLGAAEWGGPIFREQIDIQRMGGRGFPWPTNGSAQTC